MLSSFNSPPDPHQEHVRRLLDQRSARADLQGRFPSLSECSDTPSVYNHPFFSPRQREFLEQDSSVTSYNYEMPGGSYPPEPRSPMFDREQINDPTASMLDLEDDPRSSYAPSELDHYDQPSEDSAGDDSDSLRMSLLGPKMRFHSRAPWETEEDDLEEEDESDNSANYITAVTGLKHGRTKPTKSDGIKKGLGFGSSGSSGTSRRSGESSRPQAKPKRSFDTSSSISQRSNMRGALHPLAQASMSSTSLVPLPSPTLRHKFSTSRIRSRTPSSSNRQSLRVSPSSACSSFYPDVSTGSPRVRASTETYSSADGGSFSSSSCEQGDDIHPYANPDLAVQYVFEPPRSSSLRATLMYPSVLCSDSTTTVTNSLTTSSLSRSGTVTTLTPDTSVSSVREQSPRNRTSSVQGKAISSPLPSQSIPRRTSDGSMHSTDRETKLISLPPPHPGRTALAGWGERPTSPTFTLISLEEARAQRSRGATVHPLTSYDYSTPSVPFPREIATTSNNSPPSFATSRARARSVSAGIKAKHALQFIVGSSSPSDRRGSEPGPVDQQHFNGGTPGKLLKHKKSGFMRLFNGKEPKDKEKKAPPPVPPLSDSYFSNQPLVSKTLKVTTHRIPVPQLSPSLLEDPSNAHATSFPDYSNSPSENHSHSGSHKLSPSQKRPYPPLSIDTSSQGQTSRAPASATALDQTFQSWMTPPLMSGIDNGRGPPQSAPPDMSDFPALKLRPVSTIFSAHFGDHIVRQESPQFDRDLDTLSSTSPTAISPLTPGYFLRPDGSSDSKTAVTPEDQSSVIQALQDQILSAKRAWQQNIWDLEGQVRDLKAEVDDLRAAGNDKSACEVCGGKQSRLAESGYQHRDGTDEERNSGVVNRPRARTGISARFGSGN